MIFNFMVRMMKKSSLTTKDSNLPDGRQGRLKEYKVRTVYNSSL